MKYIIYTHVLSMGLCLSNPGAHIYIIWCDIQNGLENKCVTEWLEKQNDPSAAFNDPNNNPKQEKTR